MDNRSSRHECAGAIPLLELPRARATARIPVMRGEETAGASTVVALIADELGDTVND